MSESKAKAARKAARAAGEYTGKPRGEAVEFQAWPNRAERRRRARLSEKAGSR